MLPLSKQIAQVRFVAEARRIESVPGAVATGSASRRLDRLEGWTRSLPSLCQNFGRAPKVTIFLNAEGAEVFAEVRKVRQFSARLCENLCVLCVKILFDIAHPEF
ncbi:MAG: hypothetical protein QOH71_1373 [Blastocatellia bacterium]|nr:hypothetical protein [Blastocatellia bacterium]